jgi:hypothetical protein
MSHEGQTRPNWMVRATSVMPPIATELRTSLEVRFVPKGDIDLTAAGLDRDQDD